MGLTARELCPDRPIGLEPQVGSLPWFAVVIKPQHEHTVEDGLRQKGLESYLPVYWATRQWSDRMKRLLLPLFPGYVFCRFQHQDRVPVLRTPGVRSIVSCGMEMLPVPDTEIERIRWMLASAPAVEPWPFLKVGRRVRVECGPLRGLEGILSEVRNTTRVVIGLDLLQRSVAVQLSRDQIKPLD